MSEENECLENFLNFVKSEEFKEQTSADIIRIIFNGMWADNHLQTALSNLGLTASQMAVFTDVLHLHLLRHKQAFLGQLGSNLGDFLYSCIKETLQYAKTFPKGLNYYE